MKCPFCGFEESKVIDSRPTDEGQRIRRRRECLQCSKRFTTYEIIESLPIIVIKKDKSRETFNRDKLMTGLLRACEKRPVSIDTLDNMIDEIETVLQNSLDREVSSEKIGQLLRIKPEQLSTSNEIGSCLLKEDLFDDKSVVLNLKKTKRAIRTKLGLTHLNIHSSKILIACFNVVLLITIGFSTSSKLISG